MHRSEGKRHDVHLLRLPDSREPGLGRWPGKGKELKWPVGLGGEGNDGVAGQVKQTPGTIGYVELAYANQNKLPVAKVKNAAGQFVAPTIASITAAGAGAVEKLPPNTDYRVSIVNAPGADAYPISSFTWLLVYQRQADAGKGQEARRLHAAGRSPRAKVGRRRSTTPRCRHRSARSCIDRLGIDSGRHDVVSEAARPLVTTRPDDTGIAARIEGSAIGDSVYRWMTTGIRVMHPDPAAVHRARGRRSAAWPALKTFGFGFLTSSDWDPPHNVFGAAPAIYGTIVSSIIALVIATPLALGVAIFLSEFAPSWLRQPVAFLVDLLAAIPSVVYGLWGIFVLQPLLRDHVMPFLSGLPLIGQIGPVRGTGVRTQHVGSAG